MPLQYLSSHPTDETVERLAKDGISLGETHQFYLVNTTLVTAVLKKNG